MESTFNALGDATRRRILEILADGEQPAGAVLDTLAAQRAISQPAVSQHLKVLRAAGLVAVRAEGTRRLYRLDRAGVDAAQSWLAQLEGPTDFAQPLDALATEIARGKRRRTHADTAAKPRAAEQG